MIGARATARDRLLGRSAARAYFPLVDGLIERTQGARYSFLDPEPFLQLSLVQPHEGMRIYWSEMLSRSHLAASISLRRSTAWLDGAIAADGNHNSLAFAACVRGFLESAADTNDALNQVPLAIASTSVNIHSALAGTLDAGVVHPELEDKLIHFAYARKLHKKDSAAEKYHAKTAKDYMAEFTWFNAPGIVELYSNLCEYVHAAAPSVHMYLDAADAGSGVTITYKPEAQLELPDDLPAMLEKAAILAFTPPLLTLAVLNFFAVPELHVPEATPQICSGVPMWAKIERAMRVT